MRRLFAMVMAAALFMSLIGHTSATNVDPDGDIIYTDGVDKFLFMTDSEYTDSDQFEEFKSVMPGDTIEQKIMLRNDISNDRKIKVYMRAMGAHEDSIDFLSQLKLTIVKDTDTVLFDATAAQAAQLTDWVYLGTLYSGGECVLRVTLSVPVTMGNEYANAVGYLDWEFGVSEHPVEPDDPKPPKTDDNSRLVLWTTLLSGSLMGFSILMVAEKKKTRK